MIVHPVLQTSDSAKKNGFTQKEAISKSEEYVGKWLDRLHAVVIGPGLGRDSLVSDSVKKLIDLIKQKNLPLVIDGVSRIVLFICFFYSITVFPNRME